MNKTNTAFACVCIVNVDNFCTTIISKSMSHTFVCNA